MSKSNDVVINIVPFNTEIQTYEGGFTWTFWHDMPNGKTKKVKLKFDRWWMSYLARDLQKVLKNEYAELARLHELSGFKNNLISGDENT